jgi:hypothetical protein
MPSAAMRNISVRKPVMPMAPNTPRITQCSGLVLIRMRYGRCTRRRKKAQTMPARNTMPARSPMKM